MKVKNRSLQCLVDTGSCHSLISNRLAYNLGLKMEPAHKATQLIAASGKPLEILGQTTITFHFKGLAVTHSFLVIKDLFPSLIAGSDFLRKNHAVINYKENSVSFYDDLVVLSLQSYHNNNNCACILKTVCIPAFSEILAPVRLPKTYKAKEAILEPLKNNLSQVLVGGTLTAVKNGIGLIRMLNVQPQTATIKKNLLVASVLYPEQVASITPFKPGEPNNPDFHSPQLTDEETFRAEYKFTLCNNLTADQKRQFLLLLYRNKDVFAKSISDMKQYPYFQLRLQPKSWDIKAYTRQYKLPQAEADEAHRQILELKERGLVSESTDTTYNSAVFMVRKKQGGLRLVCDLRKINQLLRPFVVQMPKIDEILNDITSQEPRFMTSVDLYKGYHSVRLDPTTSHLTAFCSPKTGQSYQWSSLPMGLSVSAGAFVRVLNSIFQDRSKFFMLWTYVDDLLVSSRTFQDHLTHLDIVLSTLRENNLMANPTKTSVGFDELEFLGHTISAKGIKIAESKTRAVRKMNPPTNKKSLLRILGLMQYFRRHIANYSSRTSNMSQLVRGDTTFHWSDACQAEFDDIKTALINAPVLAPFRNDRKTYLYTDGAISGLGSVCLQMDDQNRPVVCSYMSVATTQAQKHWHSSQLELQAIALALKQNEIFFLQNEIEIFTDNAVCVSLEKYRPVNAREKRLLAYLSQFRFKMRYVPGRSNKVADALSRLPEDLTTSKLNDYQITHHYNNEEFILAAIEPTDDHTEMSPLDTDSAQTRDWTVYSIVCEPTTKLLQTTNDPLSIVMDVIPVFQDCSADTAYQQTAAPVAPQELDGITDVQQQLPGTSACPEPRRSSRIAIRKARAAEQQLAHTQSSDGTKQDVLQQSADQPSTPILDNNITTTDTSLDVEITQPAAPQDTNDFAAWSKDFESTIPDIDYDQVATDIPNTIETPQLTETDYLADPYFAPIYTYLKYDNLPQDDATARKTILIAENYYIPAGTAWFIGSLVSV